MSGQKQTEKKIIPFPVLIGSEHRFAKYIPQCLLQLFYVIVGPQKPRVNGIFMEFGKFIWIQNKDAINELYKSGSFGKGDLSRSNPTWFSRTVKQDKNSLEEITVQRRKKRRNKQFNDDSNDVLSSTELLDFTANVDVELFHLDFYESFFLMYGLNALSIINSKQVR